MASAIEWTGETLNPVRARLRSDPTRVGWHCEHASPGCLHCYAESRNVSGRCNLGTRLPYKPGHRKDVEIFLDEKVLLRPLKWRKPRTIFWGSMTDLFAGFVTDAMLDRMFAVMALTPHHTHQVLTKRADRMRAYFADSSIVRRVCTIAASLRYEGAPDPDRFPKRFNAVMQPSQKLVAWTAPGGCADAHFRRSEPGRAYPSWVQWPLPNVWLGVSVEDQQRAEERREDFRETPAGVKFVSYEPALGPVDWTGWEFVQQIISGGESGPKARPHHPDWHRATRDFCASRGIAYFFKQWGEFRPCTEAELKQASGATRVGTDPFSASSYMMRVGKKAAGRLLDGVEHNGMPAHGQVGSPS